MPTTRTASGFKGNANAAAAGSMHSATLINSHAPNTKPSVLISTTWPI